MQRWDKHSPIGDQGAHQLRRCHVERWTVDRRTFRSKLHRTDPGKFLGGPLFDRDFGARVQIVIHTRDGSSDKKRHPVSMRCTGQTVCTDFVRHIAIGRDAVSPDKDSLHLVLAHQERGARICHERERDAEL